MTVKIIVAILSTVGVLGTLVPAVPGTPLILLGALIYGFTSNFAVYGWGFIGILVLLSILAEGLDYLASVLGAKYFGASRFGVIGAIGGGILATIFLGPIGLVIGPLLGAIIVELLRGKKFEEALKVGVGTIVGNVSGSIISFLISILMTILLLVRVF
jgi:hypothetical protein